MPTVVQFTIVVHLLIAAQAQEFPLLIVLSMQPKETAAETAGLRLICTGPL